MLPPGHFFIQLYCLDALVSPQKLQKKPLLRNIAAVRGQNLCRNVELGLHGNWNIVSSSVIIKNRHRGSDTALTLFW